MWELIYVSSCVPAPSIPREQHVGTYFQVQAKGAEIGKDGIKQRGKLDCFEISGSVASLNI